MTDQPSTEPAVTGASRPRRESCIILAGGSGFIGRRLAAVLGGAGYDVVILTRGRAKPPVGPISFVSWQPSGRWSQRAIDEAGPGAADSGSHAVINLCGESIGGPRWSEKRKALLVDSRVTPTETLVRPSNAATEPPALFVQASGVGYYGPATRRWMNPAAAARTFSPTSPCSGKHRSRDFAKRSAR